MELKYGPCIGLSRKERWQRADKMGLEPPAFIWKLLTAADETSADTSSRAINQSLWETVGSTKNQAVPDHSSADTAP